MNLLNLCIKYEGQIERFQRLITLLSYDLDNIELQVELLKLHYEIQETRQEMRKRLRLD